jgi:ferredoxin
MMYINGSECVDCGACEPVCPSEAIFYEDDLPQELRPFADANRTFFDRLGNPGGARKVGKQTHDAGPAAAIVR